MSQTLDIVFSLSAALFHCYLPLNLKTINRFHSIRNHNLFTALFHFDQYHFIQDQKAQFPLLMMILHFDLTQTIFRFLKKTENCYLTILCFYQMHLLMSIQHLVQVAKCNDKIKS